MSTESDLRDLYAAFNARDADAVLVRLAPDVEWPNAWERGRIEGREAVRDYWARQWAEIDGTVEPTGFATRDDGRVAVNVHQVVRDLDGNLLSEGEVRHVYSFRDGLIARMDVEE